MTTVWARHLLEIVLPWWETHGVDDERGGVRTGFDNSGALTSSDRFTWSQGRWAWLAGELADEAVAGRLPLDATVWRDRCERTCARLVAQTVRPDGRTHFRVTEEGRPVRDAAGESATSVFADLFAALGLAAGLRQVSPTDPRAVVWLDRALLILETAHAGIRSRTALSEPYPVPPGYADLAGPMTLLHVSAEILRAPVSGTAARRVRAVRDWAGTQLMTQVFSRDHDDWWEMRPDDARGSDTLVARHRTPGHMLELLWMIDHAQDDDADFELMPPTRLHAVARRAIELGWDTQEGGVLRYVDHTGGRPQGRLLGDHRYERLATSTWDTKLWWVHVEAMYALARFGRDDPSLAAWAGRVVDYTMALFPVGPGEEWTQIRGRDGTPLEDVVALPVKDPFHIIRALLLLNRENPPHPEGCP